MHHHFLDLPGGRLCYETFGDKRNPALLFIHAGVADHTMWDLQVAEFARDHFVICHDTRGYGLTESVVGKFSDRQDITALLDHLNVAQTVLIGCSRGGQFAVDTTLEYPARVRGVVSVSGGLSGFDYAGGTTDPRDVAADVMFAAAEAAYERQDWPALAELDARIWADGLAQPAGRCRADVREKIVAMCLANYLRRAPEVTAIPLEPPAAQRLGEIRVPTLIVLGDLDTRGIELRAHTMADSIAHAQLIVIPGTAHMPSMEQADTFNRILREWLQSQLRQG
jgi:3-oxoadipate enol-lactonase